MRKLAIVAAIAAAVAVVPSAAAQQAPSPYSTVTISEQFAGLPADQNPTPYTVACDWYPAGDAQSMVEGGSYRVIFPGNHGWMLCN